MWTTANPFFFLWPGAAARFGCVTLVQMRKEPNVTPTFDQNHAGQPLAVDPIQGGKINEIEFCGQTFRGQ